MLALAWESWSKMLVPIIFRPLETCLTQSAALLNFTEGKLLHLLQHQLNICTFKALELRTQLLEAQTLY